MSRPSRGRRPSTPSWRLKMQKSFAEKKDKVVLIKNRKRRKQRGLELTLWIEKGRRAPASWTKKGKRVKTLRGGNLRGEDTEKKKNRKTWREKKIRVHAITEEEKTDETAGRKKKK